MAGGHPQRDASPGSVDIKEYWAKFTICSSSNRQFPTVTFLKDSDDVRYFISRTLLLDVAQKSLVRQKKAYEST